MSKADKPATPDSLVAQMEETRERLADTIDQLVYRASPKTIVRRELFSLRAHFVDERGNPRTDNILKLVGGAVGVVGLIVVLRKLSK